MELCEIVSWTRPADWPADVLQAVAHTVWAHDIFTGIVESAGRFHHDGLPPGYRELARARIKLVDLAATFPARPSLDDANLLLSGLPQDDAEDLFVEQLRDRPTLGLNLGNRLGGAWIRWSPRRSAAHLRALSELPRAEALSQHGTWRGLNSFARNATWRCSTTPVRC